MHLVPHSLLFPHRKLLQSQPLQKTRYTLYRVLDLADDWTLALSSAAFCATHITGISGGISGPSTNDSSPAASHSCRVVSYIRNRANQFSEEYQHNYSVLATPAEGLSGKFTRRDRKKFGSLPGITDRDYYTNSNHVPVYYKCSARHKAEVEAPYHEMTRGGHIFYVEMDGDATHNPEVIMQVVDMMDRYNIGYGSVNHNRNRCLDCGYENAETHLEKCPKCGSTHLDKLQRITGYLVGTTDRWNKAKLAELNDRVVHN